MTSTIGKLKKDEYSGYSIRSILMNPEFRDRVLKDVSVRGNETGKNNADHKGGRQAYQSYASVDDRDPNGF